MTTEKDLQVLVRPTTYLNVKQVVISNCVHVKRLFTQQDLNNWSSMNLGIKYHNKYRKFKLKKI